MMGGTGRRAQPVQSVEYDIWVLDSAKVNTVESHTSATELARLY
jgi:hypothetical protein